jgi:hypothetical protein
VEAGAAALATAAPFSRNKPRGIDEPFAERNLDMNPEIRAVFLGLVIAAFSAAVILALFYRP